ncbi:phosphoribosylamine--glycine ligase, partial [Clostridium perfringens]|nr:phosphoribosylamine--glycine ligase [Clostridium perfringens]
IPLKLDEIELEWDDAAAVCVIVVSAGYPGRYRKGEVITRLAEAGREALVFHAGTALAPDSSVVTSGGRVLGVVGRGKDVRAAQQAAYAAVSRIHFAGMYARKDIADKALAASRF